MVCRLPCQLQQHSVFPSLPKTCPRPGCTPSDITLIAPRSLHTVLCPAFSLPCSQTSDFPGRCFHTPFGEGLSPLSRKGQSALRLDRQDCLISTGETGPKAPALPRQPFNRPGFDGREQMTAEKNPKTLLASPKVLWQKPPHSGRHR